MTKVHRLLSLFESPSTVLIVEDSLEFMEVLYHRFEALGWNTLRATSVEQAKKIIDQNKDKIDLVVTDFNLGSETGNEVSEYAKEHLPGVDVILQSASPNQSGINPKLFDIIYDKVNLSQMFKDLGGK